MYEYAEEMIQISYEVLKEITKYVKINVEANSEKIKEMEKLETQVKAIVANYIESKFIEFSYIKPLALSSQRRKLEDIYQPLTISDIDLNKKEENGQKKEIKIDDFKMEIFSTSSRILIEDYAGMGKSTLMKYLFIKYIKSENITKKYIPIFLEIREFSKNKSIKEMIETALMNEEKNDEIMDQILKQNLIVFFDGFDEINDEEKEEAIKKINDFTNQNNLNFYVLSSRIETILYNLTSYKRFRIKPLMIRESLHLLKKYVAQKNEFQELLLQIKKEKKTLESFLKNPLLTSLLYRAYTHKKNLPENKMEFYEQVFEALYEAHDLTSKKGFSRKIVLGKHDFKKILMEFSFSNFLEAKIQFKESEFIDKLEKAKERRGIKFDVNNLISNLYKEVPLFLKEGNKYYWSHKSVQEYFIALKINELPKKEEFLKKMMSSKNISSYLNVFDFLYDLDQITFNKVFLTELLQEKEQIFEMYEGRIDEEILKKLFLYRKGGVKKIAVPLSREQSNSEMLKYRKMNTDFYENTNKGIIYRYLNETSFLRVSCCNFYFISLILKYRNLDIFENVTFEKSHKEILNLFEEDMFYIFDEKNLDNLNSIQEKIKRDFEDDYLLIDFEKAQTLLTNLERKIKKREEETIEIMEYI